MIPTHYTDREGGKWLPWTKAAISHKNLEQLEGKDEIVVVNGVRTHSLLFDVKKSDGGYPYNRWDCLNGWTKPNA